ncbi:MAG: conjugative transposon protein TraM [Cyclobacteriaceae bacterium]|nr:conjugative transposon protein TraM [Cyclobacteriaceae bacterium]
MKTHAEKFLQQRKFFMVLPALIMPFLTLIFWALGGGQGVPAEAKPMNWDGLNLSLPDAHFDEKEIWDKLTLYEVAARDSARYREARESDPYFDLIAFTAQHELRGQDSIPPGNKLIDSFKQKDRLSVDANEDRVNKKLQELYSEINKPATAPVTSNQKPATNLSDPQFTQDVDRLEKMMELMQEDPGLDPEMQQLESVLEKILDIQHPERMKEKLKTQTVQQKINAYSVHGLESDDNISLIGQPHAASPLASPLDSIRATPSPFASRAIQNGFYGLEDDHTFHPETENAIAAIIHDTQELVAGATVKMRLQYAITIKGKVIPKDQFVYGTCAINGERLTIEINSIRAENSLLPVSLAVYDLDGLEGIYIPGAITRDAAKQASENALQNIQLMSLDPTIGQQAASAGIEAAKGLFSKKARLIKVTVKAGYQILLMDKI